LRGDVLKQNKLAKNGGVCVPWQASKDVELIINSRLGKGTLVCRQRCYTVVVDIFDWHICMYVCMDG
jgi:hypothetical protein